MIYVVKEIKNKYTSIVNESGIKNISGFLSHTNSPLPQATLLSTVQFSPTIDGRHLRHVSFFGNIFGYLDGLVLLNVVVEQLISMCAIQHL